MPELPLPPRLPTVILRKPSQPCQNPSPLHTKVFQQDVRPTPRSSCRQIIDISREARTEKNHAAWLIAQAARNEWRRKMTAMAAIDVATKEKEEGGLIQNHEDQNDQRKEARESTTSIQLPRLRLTLPQLDTASPVEEALESPGHLPCPMPDPATEDSTSTTSSTPLIPPGFPPLPTPSTSTNLSPTAEIPSLTSQLAFLKARLIRLETQLSSSRVHQQTLYNKTATLTHDKVTLLHQNQVLLQENATLAAHQRWLATTNNAVLAKCNADQRIEMKRLTDRYAEERRQVRHLAGENESLGLQMARMVEERDELCAAARLLRARNGRLAAKCRLYGHENEYLAEKCEHAGLGVWDAVEEDIQGTISGGDGQGGGTRHDPGAARESVRVLGDEEPEAEGKRAETLPPLEDRSDAVMEGDTERSNGDAGRSYAVPQGIVNADIDAEQEALGTFDDAHFIPDCFITVPTCFITVPLKRKAEGDAVSLLSGVRHI